MLSSVDLPLPDAPAGSQRSPRSARHCATRNAATAPEAVLDALKREHAAYLPQFGLLLQIAPDRTCDGAQLHHERRELARCQGLIGIAPCVARIGVNLDEQPVGAGGHCCAR